MRVPGHGRGFRALRDAADVHALLTTGALAVICYLGRPPRQQCGEPASHCNVFDLDQIRLLDTR